MRNDAGSPPRLPAAAPKRQYLLWAMLLLAGGVVLASLFLFDPARHPFYPGCYFHSLTGLQCPGCGGLRAAHQLLHGRVGEAFSLNPLLVLVSPLFVSWAAWAWWQTRRRPGSSVDLPSKVVYAMLIAIIAFGIFRNL